MKFIILLLFCVFLVFIEAKVTPLPNDKTKQNSAKSELENALVSLTLNGIFVCTGFFINEKIITFSYDCKDNLISGDKSKKKDEDFSNVLPFYKNSKLYGKNSDIIDNTIGFIEIIVGTQMYTPISLPKITIASKPYENGTKLQIVGLALDYAGQSSTMILDVKIVAIDVCKKMYPSAKVNEKIHGCAELQNGRHFCAKSTGSILAKNNEIAGLVIYPSKVRVLECKSNVLFIKPDAIQDYLKKTKLNRV